MHASTDLRIIKCLDGLHYSFETLKFVYSTLYEVCTTINEDQSAVIPAIWQCWSFIDITNRVRDLAQTIPGLSKKDEELKLFLGATSIAKEYRNYIQHLRNELLQNEPEPFPVWGSLSWIDPKDNSKGYLVILGARIDKTNYTACVYDVVEKKWVSKVCLGMKNWSFNFDPIYDACIRFQNFIIPWIFTTFQPGIQITEKLPIVSFQFTITKY